ncbi:MAG: arylsulfatase [Phycisphaerae bacterium]|nr:arylsulfatase [Phycisphaerae bacterium]
MKRRDFLKNLAITAAAACAAPKAFAVKNQSKKTNIIYIIADDLGYGDLGCYGQKIVKTPNLDKIREEGMKFTQHYSGSTVCAPSRCVLMTGVHTGHAQVRGNREAKPEGQSPMEAGTVTIPTLLKQAGYTSGMFGKWGLGAPGSVSDPALFFDEFYGYNCQREAHTFYPNHLWHNDKKVPLDGKTYSHDLIMKNAIDFVKTNKDKPFLCYMPITIPHAAMHAPKDLHDKYRKQFPQFEDKIGKYSGPKVQNPIAAFAAMIEHMDSGIGKLMDTLKQLGIDDNTIVMFTSDNGPHLEGGHDPRFFDSNGPLRGFKRDLYEGGIRVPMIARWPGKIKPNTQTDHISAFWDVLPTLCEIANIEPLKNIDGISFLPTMLGEKQKQHEYLYWEFHEQGGRQAVRVGKWKGVRLKVFSNPNAPIELYNLETDIGEETDIADKHPEIIAKMNKIMKEARIHNSNWPFDGTPKKKKSKA